MKTIIIFMIVMSLISSISFGYPLIISEKGFNHTQAKELVYSISNRYYKYVDTITFVNNYAHFKYIDTFGQKKVWKGWNWVYWDKNHNCFNGKIILSCIDKKLLIHELCHIAEYCLLKSDYSSETFADNCELSQLKWN